MGSKTSRRYTCCPGFVFQSFALGSMRSCPCGEGGSHHAEMLQERGKAGHREQAGRDGQPLGMGSSQKWLHLPGQPGQSGHDFSGRGCPGWGTARGGRGNEPPAAVTEALTFTPAPATVPFRASWSVWETQPPSPPSPAHQVTGRWALLPHTSWAE